MRLTSPAFSDGAMIPKKYSEDGQNLSPPLDIHELPTGAQALAIIMEDPDAPREDPWVHWVLYNAPGLHHLPEPRVSRGRKNWIDQSAPCKERIPGRSTELAIAVQLRRRGTACITITFARLHWMNRWRFRAAL